MQNSKSQNGRSMVEMLGVLAIVGVLSVGGVYGYGVAMKKHKANELLHQASMLATTISAQAMTNDGKLPETITSFGNSSYGTFSTDVGETADKTGFTITISNMDGSICSQLKEGGMVQKVECNPDAKTATLTYYKNLATTEAEGKNSPTGETSTGFGDIQGKDCTDSDVVDSEICLNGKMYYCYPAGGISEWNANPWGRETIECSSCDDSYSDRMRYEGTDYCCVDGDWSVCTPEPEPEPEPETPAYTLNDFLRGTCSVSGYASDVENETYIFECVGGQWKQIPCVTYADTDGDGIDDPVNGYYYCNVKSDGRLHSNMSDVCEYSCNW